MSEFLNDGTTPVVETGSGTFINTFGAAGLVSRTKRAFPNPAPETTFYQFDPLGNAIHRLDENGNVMLSSHYSAHGSEAATDVIPTTDPFDYKGQFGYYTDRQIGLIFCTNRFYDPEAGRWINRDPIGDAGGVNLYAYCSGDPVNGVDPSGLQSLSIRRDCPTPDRRVVRDNSVGPDELWDEFKNGTGPTHSAFLNESKLTRLTAQIDFIDRVRAKIKEYANDNKRFHANMNNDLGRLSKIERYTAPVADGINMLTNAGLKNKASSFLGSFRLWANVTRIDRSTRTIQVDFHVANSTSISSLTRNSVTRRPITWPNGNRVWSDKTSGTYRTTTQDIYWSERIRY